VPLEIGESSFLGVLVYTASGVPPILSNRVGIFGLKVGKKPVNKFYEGEAFSIKLFAFS